MPKVYLVIERESGDDWGSDNVFGVFSKEEKAIKVRDELLKNFEENNEEMTIKILELTIDECTDDYDFFMCN